VKIAAGDDVLQDVDMSRKEYVDKLPPDQQKQLEELRKHNSEAMKSNEIIRVLNADLKTVNADIHDADAAHAGAAAQLGASASKGDLDAKEKEIKNAKYTEIVTLMQKDTGLRATEAILWADLGVGQTGLATAGDKSKYDDAETAYKKAIEVETASKKPRPEVIAMANAGLGEIYARNGKVSDANAAYDAAAKSDPPKASFYLTNEAKIFFQTNNSDAQIAAANEALKSDPNQPVLYYIIGNGLVSKATVDPKTGKIVAPPGCLEAYQKYLELAPDGPYAKEVADILTGFGQKINSTYKAGKKS
jgi:predicted Zn-dependent protease